MLAGKGALSLEDRDTESLDDAKILKGINNPSGCINKAAKAESEGDYLTAVRTIEAGMRRFTSDEDRLGVYLSGLLQRTQAAEKAGLARRAPERVVNPRS
ncbi:MAG TPA: hypothetical protein VL944_03390 [Candidatus Acidoferrum sp.]|nr:hypothetical protein [Candidatus Acidoferrum sp.]